MLPASGCMLPKMHSFRKFILTDLGNEGAQSSNSTKNPPPRSVWLYSMPWMYRSWGWGMFHERGDELQRSVPNNCATQWISATWRFATATGMDICDRTSLPSPNCHSMVEVTFQNKAAWDTWTLGNTASDSKIMPKCGYITTGCIVASFKRTIVANRKPTECGVHDQWPGFCLLFFLLSIGVVGQNWVFSYVTVLKTSTSTTWNCCLNNHHK